MIDPLGAFDLWWIVWEVLVDGESKREAPPLIHALVWLDSEIEVENIIWIWEMNLACFAQGQLLNVLLSTQLCSSDFLLLWSVGVCSCLLLCFLTYVLAHVLPAVRLLCL